MSDASKWISGLAPDQPATEAALLVLKPRLDNVVHFFPQVIAPPTSDIEPVHQLRVSTRRTGAALKLFRDVLPHRWYRKTREVIRILRQSAGQARDWDVFHQRLIRQENFAHNPVHQLLSGIVFGQRLAAQSRLDELGIDFELRLADVVRTLPEKDELVSGGPTLHQLGDEQLAEFLHEFSTAVEAQPSTSEQLHQLRILGKRVRYALEVFSSCYGEQLKSELYPLIEELQEVLGGVQDAQVGLERMASIQHLVKVREPELLKAMQPHLKLVSKAFTDQLAAQKRAYRSWLKRWQPYARVENWAAWLNHPSQVPGREEPMGGMGSDNPPGPDEGRGGGSSSSGPTTRRSPRPAGKPSPRGRVRGSTSGKSGSPGRSG